MSDPDHKILRKHLEQTLSEVISEIQRSRVTATFEYSNSQNFEDLGDDSGNYIGQELAKAEESVNRAINILSLYL